MHACLTGPARVCARAEALQLAENLLVADVTAENFGFAAQVPNKRRLKSQSSLVSRPRARPSGINVALKKFAVQFNAVQGPAVTMTVNDVEAECAASLTFAAGQLSCVLASLKLKLSVLNLSQRLFTPRTPRISGATYSDCQRYPSTTSGVPSNN